MHVNATFRHSFLVGQMTHRWPSFMILQGHTYLNPEFHQTLDNWDGSRFGTVSTGSLMIPALPDASVNNPLRHAFIRDRGARLDCPPFPFFTHHFLEGSQGQPRQAGDLLTSLHLVSNRMKR